MRGTPTARSAQVSAVVASILATGCVPSTSREGVGGYCHRDDHCIEGLRCVELECRAAARPPQPDGGRVDAWTPAAPPDTGPPPTGDAGDGG